MAESVSPSAAKPAYRDLNILRWLFAYTASVVGDSAFLLALGWATSEVAGPSEVGLVVAVGAVPRAILMLGGGVVADRLGPRLVVISSDAVRCLVALVAVAFLLAAPLSLWMLIGVALVFGIVDALFMPAVGALPPLITRRDQLVRVQGMRALAVRLGNTAGAPLAGMMMAFGGPIAAFTTVAGLFALSLLLLVFVRITPPAPSVEATDSPVEPGMWRDLLDGLRYVHRRPVIRTIVITVTLVELGSVAPLNIGFLLLANERGWGASGAGWIIGAAGVGAGASALLLTILGMIPKAGPVYIASLILGSVAVGFFALVPNLPTAVFLGGATGLMLGLNGGLAFAFIQADTNPAFLGRVMSLLSLASVGVGPLTYPVFGTAVAAAGMGSAFIAFAVIALLGAAFCLMTPTVRQIELCSK
ncbi:MFS transporter [Streptomyces sp. NPDC015350]|uniref:MFS transporter n=1 Tax=Streptomyces sp. NPDC015350 TaxID=3364955 RepID=UPI0036F809D9